MNKEHQIKQILHWTGFTLVGQKNSIYNDSIHKYGNLLNMKEYDMTYLTKDHTSRATVFRINFGIRRIKKLRSIIHWCKDHRRTSTTLNIVSTNRVVFGIEILRTIHRA